ncbi:MAG: hypothetical protein HY721_14035 [Planctomycetes bacterium]|nr:hypothetical protein [Planctomycetota bacterium]
MDIPLREENGVLWYDRIAFVPSVHGKAAFARETRRVFLDGRFPTIAVELPESLAEKVLEGIARLPVIHVVSYEESSGTRCFFPIDPCDSIVEALRLGVGESCALELIDMDVEDFRRMDVVLPDTYAVSSIGLPRFWEAVEPALPEVEEGSLDDRRERHMARRLKELLEGDPRRLPVLCVLGMVHLRGVVRCLEAARRGDAGVLEDPEPASVPPLDVALHPASLDSLYHILGELPYTTHLYGESRREITLEHFEAVDVLVELLLEARDRYHEKHKEEYERISHGAFQNLLTITRNLCLLERRLTPSLYEMAVAAKGIGGSELAIAVIETAKRYPPQAAPEPRDRAEGQEGPVDVTEEAMRIGEDAYPAKKRYVDEAKVWKKLRLEPPPPPRKRQEWRTAWNPYSTCSWTPEDVLVERFAGQVKRRALLESGLAQEHLEEFRTSFKDGVHIRETIRNLHLGKIIVKETPQIRGQVGAVVVIYERPDPERFPWKLTWLPEYEWESVLAFYATSYLDDLVGPGIARAVYGGQLFVRPRGILVDIWEDPRLEEARDDAERLVFAAAQSSPDRFVAYVAAGPPSHRMKEFARRRGKKIIYLPLSAFSRTTLEKLRRFHVLNGKPVRSYARQFIR